MPSYTKEEEDFARAIADSYEMPDKAVDLAANLVASVERYPGKTLQREGRWLKQYGAALPALGRYHSRFHRCGGCELDLPYGHVFRSVRGGKNP